MDPKECVFICCLYFNSLHYSHPPHQNPRTNQLQHIHKFIYISFVFIVCLPNFKSRPKRNLECTGTCVLVLAQPSAASTVPSTQFHSCDNRLQSLSKSTVPSDRLPRLITLRRTHRKFFIFSLIRL